MQSIWEIIREILTLTLGLLFYFKINDYHTILTLIVKSENYL